MTGIDFVVSMGTDRDEVLQLGPGEQILQQVERRGIEPLQIVEKEHQRMVLPDKNTHESPEHTPWG